MILAKKLDIFVIIYLDDILTNTENPGRPYVEVVQWVLDQLWKYSLFANLKNCCFHLDKICFLKYIMLFKDISIEAKRIKVVQD